MIKEDIRCILCVLLTWLVAYSVSVSAVNVNFGTKISKKKKIPGSVLGTT